MLALGVVLVGVAAMLGGNVASASAQQQQNAAVHVYWQQQGWNNVWNVDQDIRVLDSSRTTFWAGFWRWTGSNDGGYIGLQRDAGRQFGVGGRIAILSVWNALRARGPHCGRFGGEGVGFSCRVSYEFKSNRYYKLRVWRQEAEAGGQWWGGWVINTHTGRETYIGALLAPAGASTIGQYMNFTEYFGSAVSRPSRVPRSVALYTQPAANYRQPYYDFYTRLASWDIGNGTTGRVKDVDLRVTRAARVTMGG